MSMFIFADIVRSLVFRTVQIITSQLENKKLQNISENSCLNYLFVFSSAVSIKRTHYLAFSFLTSKLYQNLIIVPTLIYQSSRKSKHPPCEHRIRYSLYWTLDIQRPRCREELSMIFLSFKYLPCDLNLFIKYTEKMPFSLFIDVLFVTGEKTETSSIYKLIYWKVAAKRLVQFQTLNKNGKLNPIKLNVARAS